MSTVLVACVGGAASLWLARAARRYAVVDRAHPLAGTARRLPRWLHAPLRRALDDAGFDVSPEHALQVGALAALAAAAIGFGIAPAVALVSPVGVLIGGAFWLYSARHRQSRLVTAAIPAALDAVAAELRAGGTVATGVHRVALDASPLAPDFARVEARVRLGAGLPDALAAWSRERPAPGASSVAGALALASTIGGRCADALEGLASSLRERLAVLAEARALSAQARYSALVIGIGPLVYLALSTVSDRRALHAVVATPTGRICLAVGAALEAAGAWWMRRVLAGVER